MLALRLLPEGGQGLIRNLNGCCIWEVSSFFQWFLSGGGSVRGNWSNLRSNLRRKCCGGTSGFYLYRLHH